jgi:hypothetical protein
MRNRGTETMEKLPQPPRQVRYSAWRLLWDIIARRADTLAQRHALLVGVLLGSLPFALVAIISGV